MRAAVYHGRRDVQLLDVPEPSSPASTEVVIDVSMASICGTDLGEYVHGPRMIPLDNRHDASGHVGRTILGHELVGTIAAAGSDVDRLEVGARVVPGAGFWCGRCRWCRAGQVNLCRDYFVFGLHAHGGLAEQVAVPVSMCHRVPDGCSDVAAAMAQPLAIALHALGRSGARRGESVAIIGVGGIGSFVVAAARAMGAVPLLAVDVNTARLEAAERLGATVLVDAASDDPARIIRAHTQGDGVDVVVEASGSRTGLRHAFEAVRRGGRVQLVGLQSEPISLGLHELVTSEVDVLTSNGHVCDSDLPRALELLRSGELAEAALGRLIGLEDVVPQGLVAMAEGQVNGKVVVSIDG